MAKRGRPRKSGHRETNGRLQRPTLEQMRAIETAQRLRETDVVAMQPHRRWARNPRDPILESALGRFIEANRLRAELLHAGRSWARKFRVWCLIHGVRAPYPVTPGAGGGGPDMAPEEIDRINRTIDAIEARLKERGQIAYLGARSLCLDDADISTEVTADAIAGLVVVAVELGRLPAKDSPFVDSRRAAA
jgi:hypothetical protein